MDTCLGTRACPRRVGTTAILMCVYTHIRTHKRCIYTLIPLPCTYPGTASGPGTGPSPNPGIAPMHWGRYPQDEALPYMPTYKGTLSVWHYGLANPGDIIPGHPEGPEEGP